MKRRIVILWFVMLSFVLVVSGDIVIDERASFGMRHRTIRVSADSFHAEYLERLCRIELAKRPRVHFIHLEILGPVAGAPLPKPFSAYSYRYWLNMYTEINKSSSEIAEMISIGNDSVLRMREKDGKISRRVLTGSDPLRVEIGDKRVELLHFAFNAPGALGIKRIDIYARASTSLTESEGMRLFRALEPSFRGHEVYLYIRNDPWFVYEPSYPFVNPFGETHAPPNEQDYRSTRTLRCGRWTSTLSCSFIG